MSDESIAARIESLVSEEHELRGHEQQDSAKTGALKSDGGYAGFVPYPYREYSEAFFDGRYKVLRGGS